MDPMQTEAALFSMQHINTNEHTQTELTGQKRVRGAFLTSHKEDISKHDQKTM